jgi:hypothetical protein
MNKSKIPSDNYKGRVGKENIKMEVKDLDKQY